MAKKDLVKKNAQPPAVIKHDALALDDIVTDEGAGLENIGAADLALPFLMILQSGSPQVKKGEQQVEGASEGHIYNTVSQEIYDGDEGIFIIPCVYKKAFVEWKPRESGGGFVTQHDDDTILNRTRKDPNGRDILDNGHIVVATAYHYVLLVNPVNGDFTRAVIGMSSTQLKKSRRWNSLITGIKVARADGTKFTPAMFSHMYRMTTEVEQNELGAWCGWKIELYGMVPTKELYAAAKKYSSDLKAGLVREAAPPQTDLGDASDLL